MTVLAMAIGHSEHVSMVLLGGLYARRKDVGVLVDLVRVHGLHSNTGRESILSDRVLTEVELHGLQSSRCRLLRLDWSLLQQIANQGNTLWRHTLVHLRQVHRDLGR